VCANGDELALAGDVLVELVLEVDEGGIGAGCEVDVAEDRTGKVRSDLGNLGWWLKFKRAGSVWVWVYASTGTYLRRYGNCQIFLGATWGRSEFVVGCLFLSEEDSECAGDTFDAEHIISEIG
jgi:hypothetical protein